MQPHRSTIPQVMRQRSVEFERAERHPAALRIAEAELECDHLAGSGIADQGGQGMLTQRPGRDVGLKIPELILVGRDRLGRDTALFEVEPGRATGRDRHQPVEEPLS